MAEYIERGVAMDVREKLVKLLKTSPTRNGYTDIEDVADHLITNGVTVQEWISVTERLPENGEWVLCFMKDTCVGTFRVLQWNYIDWQWNDENEWFDEKDVTHWMPLPEPPKMDGGADNGKTDV